MRLLNTSTYELEEFVGSFIPEYAILSHTWEDEEVLFSDLRDEFTRKAAELKNGWQKVLGTCRQARIDGLEWVWIDTCCIDKESSAELSEAINSMFRYYGDSFVCYAYLSDYRITVAGYPDARNGNATFERCRWFTRGWTLQELLAPADMVFFDAEWKDMGTRLGLRDAISKVTGIYTIVLVDGDLQRISIAAKMSWAADRQTTREEDRAYSLMGLFGVNMPLLYGEGEDRAFMRLQEEIIKYSNDLSIFAWSALLSDEGTWDSLPQYRGLLARCPSEFKDSGDVVTMRPVIHSKIPYSLTNKGLHIQLPLEPVPEDLGRVPKDVFIAHLNCEKTGAERLGIYLRKIPNLENTYERWHPHWLLKLYWKPSHWIIRMKEIYVQDFRPSYLGCRRRNLRSSARLSIGWSPAKDELVSLSSKTACIDLKSVQEWEEYSSSPSDSRSHARYYEIYYHPNTNSNPVKINISFVYNFYPGHVFLRVDNQTKGLHRRGLGGAPPNDQVIMPINESESLLITARRERHPKDMDTILQARHRLAFDTISNSLPQPDASNLPSAEVPVQHSVPTKMSSLERQNRTTLALSLQSEFWGIGCISLYFQDEAGTFNRKWGEETELGLVGDEQFHRETRIQDGSKPSLMILRIFPDKLGDDYPDYLFERRMTKQLLLIFEIRDFRVCWYKAVPVENIDHSRFQEFDHQAAMYKAMAMELLQNRSPNEVTFIAESDDSYVEMEAIDALRVRISVNKPIKMIAHDVLWVQIGLGLAVGLPPANDLLH
ncbi:hypothetical protein D9758_012905 [Tetrapyrgos nigripes]|uniref:Heterokaryon incompatibility domain-containing protein n=1 Tax=Tetrapyrgos nigripes TaxID=182062 RepID=A0A8H5FPF1_9AGAR|nr:hypothetical protein D9758_012905 [Tetrapyrgos nigripes]